jgi:hypothetical protein
MISGPCSSETRCGWAGQFWYGGRVGSSVQVGSTVSRTTNGTFQFVWSNSTYGAPVAWQPPAVELPSQNLWLVLPPAEAMVLPSVRISTRTTAVGWRVSSIV